MCLKRLINRLREQNTINVMARRCSYRVCHEGGAVAQHFTLTTQLTQQKYEPDLGPGVAFLIEYHRGIIADVRQDNRDTTINTHWQ